MNNHDFEKHICNGCGAICYSENLAYELNNDDTCYISGIGECTDIEIYIPEYIDGYRVTGIGASAFSQCKSIASVTIPNSVTSIGNNAFNGCSSLTSITIPDSVTSIGAYAFWGTAYDKNSSNWEGGVLYIGDYLIESKGVTGSYTIKAGTKVIAAQAFLSNSSLTSITIPDSVTIIGNGAFGSCRNLTSVVIGNGVTIIDKHAFMDCRNLTSVVIGNGVTNIGSAAFAYCSNLTNITFTGTVREWGKINKGGMWNENLPATRVICSDGTTSLN